MPAQPLPSEAEAARKAALVWHPGLRELSAAEAELLAHAVEAGAAVRRDDAMADFLNGIGGLPVSWGDTAIATRWTTQQEADDCNARTEARRVAFVARCRSGDLRPLVDAIDSERAPQAQRVAA